ncbi:hypothetical protein, partial [uncultured Desulfovibrio sp.]|uniref:hypothetical protein n=1 Tax=uncultured Desulfovibrio sp. TaxID=167968 RepID=UPI0025F54A32
LSSPQGTAPAALPAQGPAVGGTVTPPALAVPQPPAAPAPAPVPVPAAMPPATGGTSAGGPVLPAPAPSR